MNDQLPPDAEYVVTRAYACYPRFHFGSGVKKCGIHDVAWPCPEAGENAILAAPVPHETEAPQRATIACDIENCAARFFGEYRGHQPTEIAVEIMRDVAEQDGWGRGDGSQDLCPLHSGSAALRVS